MKCAACGKEFGDGGNCQNCGVDRVTGLANYSGYGNHSRSSNHYTDNAKPTSNKTTACYACGEIIPSDAEYCPYCRKKLFEICPRCGKDYSSQFENCPYCGTNRVQYIKKLKAEEEEARRKKREEQYKREAQELKDRFAPSKASILALPLTAWILFVLTPFYPLSGYVSLLVVIGGAILLWRIACIISESIGESKMNRWKQENPNDPRTKYL